MNQDLASQLATAASGLSSQEYFATDATTEATFSVKEKFGLLTCVGRIPLREARVRLDDDGLPHGTATLDIARIQTPHAKRDRDLRGRRFFDVASHPTIGFRSTSAQRTADGVVVEGLLIVTGQNCPLRLLTTLTAQPDGSIDVHATGTFDRMASPLRSVPRWVISPTVEITLQAVLRPRHPGR